MNMGNFSWVEQGKKLQLCYHLEEREIVDARGVGLTAEQEIEGMIPYQFTSAAGERTFVYQVGKRTAVSGSLSSVMGKTDFLTLCQNVIESLVRLQQRGTDTQKLVYHVSCIFLDKKTLRPDWIYLPLREYDAPDTALGELLTELCYQARLGSPEDGVYTRELLRYLSEHPMAELAELRQLVEGLLQRAVFETQLAAQTTGKKKKKRGRKKEVQPVPPMPPVGIPGNAAPAMYAGGHGFTGAFQAVRGMQPASGSLAANRAGAGVPAFSGPAGPVSGETAGRPAASGATGTGFELFYRQMAQGTEPPPPAVTEGSSETVVLGGPEAEEEGTTVLGASAPAPRPPALIRLRTGETIRIGHTGFCLGKGRNGTDYMITDNSAISRSHVRILWEADGYYAEDQHSTNHTYLNGAMVDPGKPAKLSDGDVLKLADEEFRFVTEA